MIPTDHPRKRHFGPEHNNEGLPTCLVIEHRVLSSFLPTMHHTGGNTFCCLCFCGGITSEGPAATQETRVNVDRQVSAARCLVLSRRMKHEQETTRGTGNMMALPAQTKRQKLWIRP